MKKHLKRLTRYSNKITSSFEKCSSLRKTTELRKTITRGKFLLMYFFFQRPTCSSRDMSNCTKSVYSISFAVHEITLHHSGVLFLSPAMFSTVDGSVRLVIAVTKFGLKQNLCEHY